MIERSVFFDAVRARPFGGKLLQGQVDGLDVLLSTWERDYRASVSLAQLAYILATAFHETGATIQPEVENLNYSTAALKAKFSRVRISLAQCDALGRTTSRKADQAGIANAIYGGAWGRENLGNMQINDGWTYRGRGYVQITGRRNYAVFADLLGVPLLANPDRAMEPVLAARIIFDGMLGGLFTGQKLSTYVNAGTTNFVGARKTVNGTDKAQMIAGYAVDFLGALKAAERKDAPPVKEPLTPAAPPTGKDSLQVVPPVPDLPPPLYPPSNTKPGLIARFFSALIAALLKRG